MKAVIYSMLLSVVLTVLAVNASAQCSICTRTAAQMGEKPARGINAGILYLAATPFAIMGVIGYRWWKKNGQQPADAPQEAA